MLEKREGADLPQRHRDTERIKDERANAAAMVGWEHICLPFLCGREVEVRPASPRTCGGYELRGVVPSRSKVDGSAPADGPP